MTARISLVLGDITEQEVDVVVNAANNSLLGGGGVDGAILRAGGPAQLDGRRKLRDRIGSLDTGKAAASEAGDMKCRWIVHVVGPVFSEHDDRSHLLESCYREALRECDALGAETVAFPAVSAGVYGWPMASAADIAITTVRNTETAVADIRFVLFGQDAYDEFERALRTG